jgi:regulator of protease activity HflC (stomatin/prohibitin superfamily)
MQPAGILTAVILFIMLLGGFAAGCPQYNLYAKRLSGQAQLAEAQSNRQIRILEAKARLESSRALAEAEIVQARGAAEANRILVQSLGGTEGYLTWRWIHMLEETSNPQRQLIYVPTSGQLPILEAGRSVQSPPAQ